MVSTAVKRTWLLAKLPGEALLKKGYSYRMRSWTTRGTLQRFVRLPEPSRIRETNNTWSRIWYRLGIFLVPDLVSESLKEFSQSRFWIWFRFWCVFSTGFGFGTVKDFNESRIWIWCRRFLRPNPRPKPGPNLCPNPPKGFLIHAR